MTSMDPIRYFPCQSLQPQDAYRRNRLLDREEDRIKSHHLSKYSRIHQAVQYWESMEPQIGSLINLKKLAETTRWDETGYIVYCPKLQQLMNKNASRWNLIKLA